MRYWIGLGSNLGDRLGTLRGAVKALGKLGTVTACSRVFAAAAIGGPPQPSFLNAAAILDSDLDPQALLAEVQKIEEDFGRARATEVRWGPRTLDLDILLCGARGEQVVQVPDALEIPHARLHERAFALAPLADLDATLIHPTMGRPIKTLFVAAQHHGQAIAPTGDVL